MLPCSAIPRPPFLGFLRCSVDVLAMVVTYSLQQQATISTLQSQLDFLARKEAEDMHGGGGAATLADDSAVGVLSTSPRSPRLLPPVQHPPDRPRWQQPSRSPGSESVPTSAQFHAAPSTSSFSSMHARGQHHNTRVSAAAGRPTNPTTTDNSRGWTTTPDDPPPAYAEIEEEDDEGEEVHVPWYVDGLVALVGLASLYIKYTILA